MEKNAIYETLKDFQPAITALIALTAAVIAASTAYLVGMAKVRSDERAEDRQAARQKLAIFARLRFEMAEMRNLAGAMTEGSAPSLEELSSGLNDEEYDHILAGFGTFVLTPALNEAWMNLDLFEVDAANNLDQVRKRLLTLRYFLDTQKKSHPWKGLIVRLNDIIEVTKPMISKLDEVILKTSTQTDHLKRSRR